MPKRVKRESFEVGPLRNPQESVTNIVPIERGSGLRGKGQCVIALVAARELMLPKLSG
jgi:hypothetical protein